MEKRTKLILGLVLPAIAVLLIEVLLGNRMSLALYRRRLRSEDPMTRCGARDKLLAMAGDRLPEVLPEIVATYAKEEIASGGAIVVARTVAPVGSGRVEVRVERRLVVSDPRALDLRSKDEALVTALDERVSELSRRLTAAAGREGGRTLVVLGSRGEDAVLRSAIPLDGQLGEAIVAATERELR